MKLSGGTAPSARQIFEDAFTLDEAGRNLAVVNVVNTRRKPSGHNHSR